MILKRVLRIISIMMILGIVMHLFVRNHQIHWQQIGFFSMSTQIQHNIYVYDPDSIAPAAKTVYAAFQKMNQLCNRFDPESELSRLNRTAYSEPFVCSPELWALLMKAKEFYTLSDGAFDITVQPLMQHWKSAAREKKLILPPPELLAKVGLDKVIFNEAERSVRFTVEGMSFDLGGIAKGAALDLTKQMLDGKQAVGTEWSTDVPLMKYLEAKFRNKVSPMNRGYIDAGGNVLTLALPPPNRDAYAVGVRNPVQLWGGPAVAETKILDESISTSGNYERYVTINGKQYTHIVNPRTGIPVENMLSVTVILKHAADADVASTAIFVGGMPVAEKIREKYPELRMLMFYRDGETGKIRTEQIGVWDNVVIPE